MDGCLPTGKIVVFDDDGYYMASVIAERLCNENLDVTYVTPEDKVSPWCDYTDEQYRVQKNLIELNVTIITAKNLELFDGKTVKLKCVYSDQVQSMSADSLVLVTTREPIDSLYYELEQQLASDNLEKRFTLSKIGDCDAPSIIADAVFAGHRWARELDTKVDYDNPIKYDRVTI